MRGPHPNNETGHIGWRLLPFNGACFSLFGCFPSSGPGCARSTLSVGEGCLRRGSIHRGLALTFRGPLHTRRLRAAPSPSRRGRGFPPAGDSLTFPWGKVPPRRRMRGSTKSVLPATLSFGEGFFEIPRKKPFTFGNTYVRISPLVMASVTFVPSAQLREKTQGGISPNPILS